MAPVLERFSQSLELTWEVEQFLFREAALLDERRYGEWIELFAPNGENLIPPLDEPDADPASTPFLQHDTLPRLQSRVRLLMKGKNVAENPAGKSSRIVSNVRVEQGNGEELIAHASFVLHHTRGGDARTIPGRQRHRLIRHGESFLFVERRCILTLDLSVGHFSFIV